MKSIFLLIITTSLYIISFNSSAQSYRNDTIFKKDKTLVIDDFHKIKISGKNLRLSKLKKESLKKKILSGKDFEKTNIPIDEIEKFIDNGFIMKRIKDINDNDVVSEITANYKKYKLIHKRTMYKHVNLKNKEGFIPVLVEGYCDLYFRITYPPNDDRQRNPHYHYYVKRENEKEITHFKGEGYLIGSSTDINYFEDCPKVIEFIKNQASMNRTKIIEAVKLYNENCSM